MTPLTNLPGASVGTALGVSADGHTIVGWSTSGFSTAERKDAVVWTTAEGVKLLKELLLAQGVDPAANGWTALTEAAAISADGRYVAGTGIRNGNTEAFLADLKAVIEPTSEVTTTVSGGAVTLWWNAAFRTAPTVHRATKPEGPYTAVATGTLLGSYTETPPNGALRFYRVVWP